MAWFKRKTKGIQTSTKEKKDTPEGCGIRHLLVKLLTQKN
jgi:acetyl-CoA carboxylase carboxyl transferase subunit beta